MLTITKKFSFCYGHRLPGYLGKCVNQHGHNSEVEVEVTGKADGGYPSMVIDFGVLKTTMNTLIDKLDHKYLNDALPEGYQPPTAENMTQWFADEIQKVLPNGVTLVRVRVSETPTSWAEWRPK
jgi:6-pyruvoyltetrahydropterin/6-carboxytetrahydropterin synthase